MPNTQLRHHRAASLRAKRGLTMRDPVIHTDHQNSLTFLMDCRAKPGNDKEVLPSPGDDEVM